MLVVWIVHWHWSVLGLGAVGDSEAALPGGRLQHATSVGGHFDQWKWNIVILLSGYGIVILHSGSEIVFLNCRGSSKQLKLRLLQTMMAYLCHDVADVINALCDGLTVAADGDGALGAVGEHLTGHLHAGSSHLPHLLDLGPALA